MVWIYSSGTASGKCRSTAESLRERPAVKKGCRLLSPAEDGGLQRKTWLQTGCAKTTGKREFPQQQQCPSTGQGSVSHCSSTCARYIQGIRQNALWSSLYLLGGSPELCCCCLAASEELLGDCSNTARGTEVASSTSVIHRLKNNNKRTFPDWLFWCFWREQCPGEGVGYTAGCHQCPTYPWDSQAQRELCFFQTRRFKQTSASRAKAYLGKQVRLVGFTGFLSCQKEYQGTL